MKKLMIIDGSSLLFRAFFALPPLKSALGTPTNAVYGFLTMLIKLYEEINPDYIAVAFDKGRQSSVLKCTANIKAIVQMHRRIYALNLVLFKMY